jgi:hypothetical protein
VYSPFTANCASRDGRIYRRPKVGLAAHRSLKSLVLNLMNQDTPAPAMLTAAADVKLALLLALALFQDGDVMDVVLLIIWHIFVRTIWHTPVTGVPALILKSVSSLEFAQEISARPHILAPDSSRCAK